jgi:hypothetical protein
LHANLKRRQGGWNVAAMRITNDLPIAPQPV